MIIVSSVARNFFQFANSNCHKNGQIAVYTEMGSQIRNTQGGNFRFYVKLSGTSLGANWFSGLVKEDGYLQKKPHLLGFL